MMIFAIVVVVCGVLGTVLWFYESKDTGEEDEE